ncbi:hypothetical protein PR202_ga17251 [Eleusine coracana subsp. coracana]|uniref:Uncharacterized protein n=1 Tax=Eleusine coracana subsp. coracana TaxID=191504 RepID=A0AAV5CPT3_ELECO|nr:hypothetical protein QOZ80_6AG0516460 [Eleusine coracana subsp. coracana]GJN00094.1 hypothetical protein PR202_ga17251 [Eleusine coracana subsp. coracana]
MIGTSSSAKAAADGALGSKAARACDGCLRRRARWYCAADDAFLCQGCDTSVHSANPLARRHERLRLHPSSSPLQPPPPAAASAGGGGGSNNNNSSSKREVVPAWFRRKARTPRGGGHGANNSSNNKSGAVVGRELSRRLVVVPEALASEKSSPDEGRMSCVEEEEEEEHLLYRVPVFDPTLAEFCSPPPPLEESSCCNDDAAVTNPTKPDAAPPPPSTTQFFPDGGHAAGFEPTDAELREFAADMEALLGRGLDDGTDEDSSFYMETLGLLDPVVTMDGDESDAARVKVEAENNGFGFDAAAACRFEVDPGEASDEMLDIDFDYGSPTQEEEEEKAASSGGANESKLLQRSLSLTLNYEAIIQSWGASPWTGGGDRPPHVKIDDCWPHDYTGMWMVGGVVGHGGGGEELSVPRLGMDGGREARVSRYREKRRTRLFSKKIRYEVRKLNAEKRPRMKGRFVKRATAGGGASVAIAGIA